LACYLSSRSVHHWFGAGKIAQIADVALSIPLGAAVYYALCRAMRVPELEAAWTLVGQARSLRRPRRPPA